MILFKSLIRKKIPLVALSWIVVYFCSPAVKAEDLPKIFTLEKSLQQAFRKSRYQVGPGRDKRGGIQKERGQNQFFA